MREGMRYINNTVSRVYRWHAVICIQLHCH